MKQRYPYKKEAHQEKKLKIKVIKKIVKNSPCG